jgi:hypothetical protein
MKILQIKRSGESQTRTTRALIDTCLHNDPDEKRIYVRVKFGSSPTSVCLFRSHETELSALLPKAGEVLTGTEFEQAAAEVGRELANSEDYYCDAVQRFGAALTWSPHSMQIPLTPTR